MFLKVVEYLSIILCVILLTTQIIVPMYKGRKLFPFFRDKETELEDALIAANQKKAETDIKEEVKDIRQKAKATAFQRQRQRKRKWEIPPQK